MCMMAMAVGSTVLLAGVFGKGCGTDYSVTLSILFGAALGGKAWQKQSEKTG